MGSAIFFGQGFRLHFLHFLLVERNASFGG